MDLWCWRTLNRLSFFWRIRFLKFHIFWRLWKEFWKNLWRTSFDTYWFSTVREIHSSDAEVVWSTLKYGLFCSVLEIPAVSHSPQLHVESCDCTTIALLAALWARFIACAMISSRTLNKSGPELLILHCYATNSLWMSLSVWMSYISASFHHKTVVHCFVDCTSQCHQMAFLRWIGFTFILNPVWYRDRQRGVFVVWSWKALVYFGVVLSPLVWCLSNGKICSVLSFVVHKVKEGRCSCNSII